MNIANVFRQQAEKHPDKAALIESRKGQAVVVTFAELERRVAQTASLFEQCGLKAGAAVLVFVPMSVALYVALVALLPALSAPRLYRHVQGQPAEAVGAGLAHDPTAVRDARLAAGGTFTGSDQGVATRGGTCACCG